MDFSLTSIPDVLLIKPQVFTDDRGFFLETYRHDQFRDAGIDVTFVQDNHSGSRKGTLRGLHFQIHQAQGKLVRALVGEVFDVAVDLRKHSATFKNWVGYHLTAENKDQLWIPPGFAHGFYVISEWAEVTYKVTNYYAPEWERTLIWNDPNIAIEWPVIHGTSPTLSMKDSQGKCIDSIDLFE